MMKMILIKSDSCWQLAHLSYSLYQQLKLDKTFKDINIKREVIDKWDNLQIIIDDELFFDEQYRRDNERPLKPIYERLAAYHVHRIKEKLNGYKKNS